MSLFGILKNTAEKLGLKEAEFAKANPPSSADDIRFWLVHNLAARLKTDPAGLDHETPFSQLGLDSLAAVNISSQLESWLQTEIEATVLYQHTTINALSDHLAKHLKLA